MQTTTLYGNDRPENGPDLDFRNSDASLHNTHRTGTNSTHGQPVPQNPATASTDLLRQHKLL